MKIPEGEYVQEYHIKDVWIETAKKTSMEYGILVTVFMEYINDKYNSSCVSHIGFEVMGHRFEGEKELRKALDNKAFL